jgi:hypothetical protein
VTPVNRRGQHSSRTLVIDLKGHLHTHKERERERGCEREKVFIVLFILSIFFSGMKRFNHRGRSRPSASTRPKPCGRSTARTTTSACASPSTPPAATAGTRDTATGRIRPPSSAKFQVSKFYRAGERTWDHLVHFPALNH